MQHECVEQLTGPSNSYRKETKETKSKLDKKKKKSLLSWYFEKLPECVSLVSGLNFNCELRDGLE